MIPALCAAAACGLVWLRREVYGTRLTPDGTQYVDIRKAPKPYCLRWSLSLILGEKQNWWKWASLLSLGASAGLCAALVAQAGGSISRQVLAAALFCGLGGLFHVNCVIPYLVDSTGFSLMLATVYSVEAGWTVAAVVLSLVGATVRETVPLFAAAATLNPWPLVGLLAVAGAWYVTRSRPVFPNHARTQLRKVFDAGVMVLPWGVCLFALVEPSPAVLLSLALGYASLFYAADTTRLYQWAAAPLIVSTAMGLPAAWVLPAAVAQTFWPFRGDIR